MKYKKSFFTLIELLAVVMIMAIILGLSFALFKSDPVGDTCRKVNAMINKGANYAHTGNYDYVAVYMDLDSNGSAKVTDFVTYNQGVSTVIEQVASPNLGDSIRCVQGQTFAIMWDNDGELITEDAFGMDIIEAPDDPDHTSYKERFPVFAPPGWLKASNLKYLKDQVGRDVLHFSDADGGSLYTLAIHPYTGKSQLMSGHLTLAVP